MGYSERASIFDGNDPKTRVQDDVFRAVNGGWMETTEIPEDLPWIGSFVELVLQAEKHVREIIEDLAKTEETAAHPGRHAQRNGAEQTGGNANESGEAHKDAHKIGALFSSWMDVDALNAKGTAPLRADLAPVEAATDRDGLARVVGELLAAGVPTFFDWDIDADLADPDRYVAFFEQSGLGLPDEAYYREEQHAETLAKYSDFVPRLLALGYGLSEEAARAQADVVLRLETAIASAHMNVVDARDADKLNNPFVWADFVESAPGFAWNAALAGAQMPVDGSSDVIVMQPHALREAARLWAETPLADLKAYTRWRILRARATFLTEEIDRANFDFYGKVLRGTAQQRERWKRGVAVVEDALGEALGREYVARHFPPEHKEKMLQLVGDLLEAYRRSISALDWMGEETKARALAKVDAFSLKIGYPDEWRDYSDLKVGEDLVDNIRAANRWENARDFAKLGKPMDRSEWLMFPQTVNAYYYPVWNEIVFPAAILQFPFFDPERDAALNYGAIGAVIGHEIGHGFDDRGSRFDADGAIRNWWTDADRAAFEERTHALVAQYDAYIPAELGPDGPHVNGRLTLGENIGDLGGLSIALKAYEIALEREGKTLDDADVLDGHTAAQRFFLSYARSWREKMRREFLETTVATDEHPPSEFRANGVVKNIDAFAEAFGLQPGDALYLPPEERVRIW